MKWLLYSEYFIYVSILVSLVLAFFFRKLPVNERCVAITVFIYTAADIVSSVLAYHKIQNLWFFNIIFFPQFAAITYCFASNMSGEAQKRIVITGWLVLSVLHALNILYFQGFHTFCSFTFIPSCTWMAVSAYLLLRDMLEQQESPPFATFIAWFALATLIDNAGAIPIISILGWNSFIQTDLAYRLWEIVMWLYTFWYLIILFGLLWTRTTLRSVFYS